MMTVGSLFSGIGGLDLGLERAGMRVLWQCESDPACRTVLARHWPNIQCYHDVRRLGIAAGRSKATNWPASVDLLCGGFPCQPTSVAGRRQGRTDPRWLWPQFARLIRQLRPGYVLVENPPGLLRREFADVLGDLAASGYDAEWDCIPASALGASHLRYRIFLVAYTQGIGRELRTASGERPGGPSGGSNAMADTYCFTPERSPVAWAERHPWPAEPAVGRVVDGFPGRVDELKALGNAVVPQVAEWVGRQIIRHAQEEAA